MSEKANVDIDEPGGGVRAADEGCAPMSVVPGEITSAEWQGGASEASREGRVRLEMSSQSFEKTNSVA